MVQREPNSSLSLEVDLPPLTVDDTGVARVGDSRVTLDLVVEQYNNGMTPEDLVRAYDTLSLADVHAVIAYYLRHGDEVRKYIEGRENEAAALRASIESSSPPVTRSELTRRSTGSETADAPLGK